MLTYNFDASDRVWLGTTTRQLTIMSESEAAFYLLGA